MSALIEKMHHGVNRTKDILWYCGSELYDITIRGNLKSRLDAIKARTLVPIQSYMQPWQAQVQLWGQRVISFGQLEVIANAHRALDVFMSLNDTASNEERHLAKLEVIVELMNLANNAPWQIDDQDQIVDLIVSLDGMDINRRSLQEIKNIVKPMHDTVIKISNQGFFVRWVNLFSYNMQRQFPGLSATSA